MEKDSRRKWIVHISIFAAVMALTFWNVLRNQDFAGMTASIRKLSALSMAAAVFLAVAFVAGEGCMIWYLLKGIGEKTSLRRCISYSFIGFFFSGITPSATGGQPMQLYYNEKRRQFAFHRFCSFDDGGNYVQVCACPDRNRHSAFGKKTAKGLFSGIRRVVPVWTVFECCRSSCINFGTLFTGNHQSRFL